MREYTYARMTPEQLRTALEQLGLSTNQFIRLTGKTKRRAEDWLAGRENIPHDVLVMVSLMTLPGGLDMASGLADAMSRKVDRENPHA